MGHTLGISRALPVHHWDGHRSIHLPSAHGRKRWVDRGGGNEGRISLSEPDAQSKCTPVPESPDLPMDPKEA